MNGGSISLALLYGAEQSHAASELLNQAWSPPAIHYTPTYLEWQRTFPAPWPLPAVAAFDGHTLVGFAGTTARRVHHGNETCCTIIVSFVAVKPDRQKLGIASALYDTLLAALCDLRAPVITFAVPGSSGERVLQQAYVRAGFAIRPFGDYPSYMAMPAALAEPGDWEAAVAEPVDLLPQIAARCAEDRTMVWSAPDLAQIVHYARDPRRRAFVVLRKQGGACTGGAFVVQAELRTAQGLQIVPTVESVFLRRDESAALPVLFQEAARCGAPASRKPLISAPNLSAFDPASLQRSRIRKVGPGFRGYVCALTPPFQDAQATTAEIV
ncbi:MAG: GNAT family N-acetyltransferase [Acidobacteriaceae bacterium]|nr:GNAT family N-acetyltransferase [Acidobacteriaceae bacterium]